MSRLFHENTCTSTWYGRRSFRAWEDVDMYSIQRHSMPKEEHVATTILERINRVARAFYVRPEELLQTSAVTSLSAQTATRIFSHAASSSIIDQNDNLAAYARSTDIVS